MIGSRSHLFRYAVLAAVLASACTFVNAFDDVKPLTDGTYAPAPVPSAPDVEGPADSTTVTSDAGAGAIVVGGQVEADGATTSVLAALDPSTGLELGPRVPMVVSAIRYDGLRDIWYVLESKSADFQAGPLDSMVLHARALDRASGQWTELGALDVPPLQSYDSVVVVRDRLLFVAHAADAGGVQLVNVNTADPAKLAIVSTQPLDRTPRGMIATRSSGTGAGGVVGIIRTGAGAEGCEAGQCVEVVRVRVADGAPAIDPPLVLGPAGAGGAVPSYASFDSLERQLVVLPRATNADAAAPSRAILFEPRNQEIDGPPTTFIVTDALLRRAAVSECARQLFLVGANSDLNIHSIPILGDGGGTPAKLPTGHSGQAVYFEPTSKSVLTPFSQGSGFELAAYRLSGTPEAPVLTKRTSPEWLPPPDLRPIVLGVREPIPVVCP